MQKGNVVSDTLEKLGELAKDSGKAVANEPLKILQQALGMEDGDGASPDPLEQGVSAAKQNQQNQANLQANQLLEKKKIDDKVRVQQLLALHRQRLKEEETAFEQAEAEEEQKERLKEQEERQDEQEEIIQLHRQEAKDAVLNTPTAASGNGPQKPGAVKQAQKLTGTKEVGKSMGD